MNHEEVQNYGKIITKSVYDAILKYNLGRSTRAEDLEQICWMKILEYRQKNDKLPDFALAKKMCYDAIKDYIDYEQRRNTYSLEVDEEGDRSDWVKDDSSGPESDAEVNELVSMFPEGSKERLYLDFYLAKTGTKDTGVTPPDSREQDGYTEGNLAKMLGFSSASDRGYRKFRGRMREIVSDYFGG